MIECVACYKLALIFDHFEKYPLCREHYYDVIDPELVDNLAREIYIEDYLIPQKLQNKLK